MVSRIASVRDRDPSSKSDYFFHSQIRNVYQKPKSFKTVSWIVFFLTFVLAVILAIVLRQRVRWFRTNTTHVTHSPDILEPFNPECTEPGAKVDRKMDIEGIDDEDVVDDKDVVDKKDVVEEKDKNIVIGITGGIVACIGVVSPKRQEVLLYLAISILTMGIVNVVITEHWFYVHDLSKIFKKYTNHMLIEYGCFATRVAAAVVLAVSFLDCQLAFCSMQFVPKPRSKKLRGSHEQLSDIEYIIPRPKNTKPATHTVYEAYAQSWVFDSDNAGPSNGTPGKAPYFDVVQNGTPKRQSNKSASLQNGMVRENGHIIDNPVVRIEEASDDSNSNSNSDRKLCYMKSFSRSHSPVILSASSSQISLNSNHNKNPLIYECLEKLTEPTIYRSRLNTAVSNRSESEESYHGQPAVIMRRPESTSPTVETVQYASLMKELQNKIVHKKDASSNVASPQSNTSDAHNSKASSRSEGKSSDADFSKELEAALQLIQDLESPNTIETPSEAKSLDGQTRQLAVWRTSDASEGSEKTLSAVGSLAEIASPLAECPPELGAFKPSANGKGAKVVVHYPDSQSTSGYSSPSHGPTPNWSTTSSISEGSSDNNNKPPLYSIHNNNSSTVISLFYTPNNAKGKSVSLVKIPGDLEPVNSTKIKIDPNGLDGGDLDANVLNSPLITDCGAGKNDDFIDAQSKDRKFSSFKPSPVQTGWTLNSLLRKKKQNALPKLAPELEGAIIKSESLAYLSETELLARHQRNKEMQRAIEKKVVQQLAVPRTESNC
ncbi:unnamed protein product [Phyllotreta striolata]|uniref:Uncharacterized protein n=1 Tax=Phyllotreta striolata TaxID=444603 RepID=A0A9N9XWB5_PHYSR|nr:unnamed protein product [Phyllotreta striolata]